MNYICAIQTCHHHHFNSPGSSSVEYLLREEWFFSKSSEMDEVLIFTLFLLARYSLGNTLMP